MCIKVNAKPSNVYRANMPLVGCGKVDDAAKANEKSGSDGGYVHSTMHENNVEERKKFEVECIGLATSSEARSMPER